MRRTTSSAFVLALFLSGCTVLKRDIDVPLGNQDLALAEGETHYGEVLGELGPPLAVGALGDGFGLVYGHLEIHERQLGLGFLSWFKFAPSWAHGQREALVLVFDGDGILSGQGTYGDGERFGSGVAVQWKIRAASAVDTVDIEFTADPNAWGMRLLRSLPETLNEANSLEWGSGLEQRGRLQAAGQKSLEWR